MQEALAHPFVHFSGVPRAPAPSIKERGFRFMAWQLEAAAEAGDPIFVLQAKADQLHRRADKATACSTFPAIEEAAGEASHTAAASGSIHGKCSTTEIAKLYICSQQQEVA